jgi:hypothetical protein
VTGLELTLVPLASITGRLVLEAARKTERKSECRERRSGSLEEVIVNARRDEAVTDQERVPRVFPRSGDSAPDDQGDFKIRNLTAGRYRLLASLPGDDWYIRAVTLPAAGPGRQPVDASREGLALKSGERVQGLTITLAEGAASLRGRVAATVESAPLPATHLLAHLIPAERENADATLRFAEAAVLDDGTFTFNNIAPGRYWLIARPVADKDSVEMNPRPLAWDARGRALLRREAESANVVVDLQPCQAIADYVLRYTRSLTADERR